MTKLLLLFLFATSCVAQTMEQMSAMTQDVARSLIDGAAKRGIQQYAMPAFTVVMAEKPEFNAYADPVNHIITVNSLTVRILYGDRGELAFVIAHELGHIQDVNCQARGIAQRLSGTALQRMCEAAADQIGMQYILAAGYNPFEPAGLMGKLLMVDPNQGSVFGIVLGRFVSDHPVDVDRIHHLALAAALACKDRPEICRQ